MKPRMENAILRNLLTEALRVYEGAAGRVSAQVPPPPAMEGTRRSPAVEARGYALSDTRTENAILRRLLVELNRAFEESRDELARTKILLETVLAGMHEAVLYVDREMTVEGLNPLAEKLTGWRRVAADGRPLGEIVRLVDTDGRRVRLDLTPCLAEGRALALRQHLALVRRDGAQRSVAGRAVALRHGLEEVRGVVLFFRPLEQDQV